MSDLLDAKRHYMLLVPVNDTPTVVFDYDIKAWLLRHNVPAPVLTLTLPGERLVTYGCGVGERNALAEAVLSALEPGVRLRLEGPVVFSHLGGNEVFELLTRSVGTYRVNTTILLDRK